MSVAQGISKGKKKKASKEMGKQTVRENKQSKKGGPNAHGNVLNEETKTMEGEKQTN